MLGVPFVAGGVLAFVIGIIALILIRFVKFSASQAADESVDLPRAEESV